MSGGKYFYVLFLVSLTILGLASIAVLAADIATAVLNDTTPAFHPAAIWAVAFGTGSLITSIISAVKD